MKGCFFCGNMGKFKSIEIIWDNSDFQCNPFVVGYVSIFIHHYTQQCDLSYPYVIFSSTFLAIA